MTRGEAADKSVERERERDIDCQDTLATGERERDRQPFVSSCVSLFIFPRLSCLLELAFCSSGTEGRIEKDREQFSSAAAAREEALLCVCDAQEAVPVSRSLCIPDAGAAAAFI